MLSREPFLDLALDLGPSFLIVDPTNGMVAHAPPFAQNARKRYRFGPLTVYEFGYDIARHINVRGEALP